MAKLQTILCFQCRWSSLARLGENIWSGSDRQSVQRKNCAAALLSCGCLSRVSLGVEVYAVWCRPPAPHLPSVHNRRRQQQQVRGASYISCGVTGSPAQQLRCITQRALCRIYRWERHNAASGVHRLPLLECAGRTPRVSAGPRHANPRLWPSFSQLSGLLPPSRVQLQGCFFLRLDSPSQDFWGHQEERS